MAEFKRFLRGIGNSNRNRQQGVEDGPELIIVVMGSTGTGKSSLINALTNTESATVSDSLDSETSDIKVTPWIFSRRRIKLVDTPGFDDTRLSDTVVLKKIADFLQASFGRQVFVNGIIYLHRIIDPRMTGTAVKNLQLLQDLCGNEMKNVLLVTTFWDMVQKGIGEKRETELRTSYWAPLLELGSRMHRYKHKSSGQEIMQDILSNQSSIIELQLQIELTQAERSLLNTTAGKTLQEGLNHQLEQLGMTLNQVQGERRAIENRKSKGRDEKTRVNAHENRILEEIAAIEKDLEMLRVPRYIAMEEIDNSVAEIATEKGRDSIDAFWEFYGAVDDESERGMGSPRESLTINPQPTSPGYKPAGFIDQQFGRDNTKRIKQPKAPRRDSRTYDNPREETRDIVTGFDNLQLESEGYNNRSVGRGREQVEPTYDPHEYNDHSVDEGDQFDQYVDQNMGQENNIVGYRQPQRGGANDFDEYGNPRHNTGGYGNQYRRDPRGY